MLEQIKQKLLQLDVSIPSIQVCISNELRKIDEMAEHFSLNPFYSGLYFQQKEKVAFHKQRRNGSLNPFYSGLYFQQKMTVFI